MSTILEIANADRNLSNLIKGLKAANLEDILNGIGPFTVLAPVNMAFGNLNSPAIFTDLLKQGNKSSRLSDILTHRILKDKKLAVNVIDDEVRINGLMILARDRQGSNGVVHSIDSVNLPAV